MNKNGKRADAISLFHGTAQASQRVPQKPRRAGGHHPRVSRGQPTETTVCGKRRSSQSAEARQEAKRRDAGQGCTRKPL